MSEPQTHVEIHQPGGVPPWLCVVVVVVAILMVVSQP